MNLRLPLVNSTRIHNNIELGTAPFGITSSDDTT